MQVWDAMAFSDSSWKGKGQITFGGSLHRRIVCSCDLQTLGRSWGLVEGLVEEGSGVVTKVPSAASVYGHDFGGDYRGAYR